ncbi:MAG: nicotinate (nicotinamide) nucleotide adenylyltransferase [Clostridia bacterium]|nr:nicotinate (nicotinamide) nucleotide adenylyltransferase [Clostridia bacterium]
MKKKLVFFGGTFDPPHIEHVKMVEAVEKEISPDKIIIMPTFIPPHKKVFMPASPKNRLEMCKIAFAKINGAVVSDYEIKQKGKSFSYLTVKHLAEEYSDYEILFLMGTDMLSSFHTWKNPTEILKFATPLLCQRQGEDKTAVESKEEFFKKFGVKIGCLNFVGKDLSSTQIKIKKLLKLSVDDSLIFGVNEYIDRHFLYNGGKIADFVISNLTEKRLVHTKGVIELALRYAKAFGVSLKKTLKASLLHDVAKYLSLSDYPEFVPPKAVPSQVMHQYLGAYVAEKELGVKDKEVLNAIRYHTSAKPNMSLLAKIVFTADMLEEGRTYDGVEKIRALSFEDFDKAFILSMQRSLDYVYERGCEVYPLTLKAYEYYAKRK